jgi:hypothetical protein
MAGPFQGSDLNPALNNSGIVTASPRCNSKHQRHAKFARETKENYTSPKMPDQFSTFLSSQATRLGSTPALIFAKLVKNTAARIRAAATFGSLS